MFGFEALIGLTIVGLGITHMPFTNSGIVGGIVMIVAGVLIMVRPWVG